MKIELKQLRVRTRKSTEVVSFSPTVTFIHGPVGTGKSTVARLVDYCLGGRLERTPAIQQEFLSAELAAVFGRHSVLLERGADDADQVRASWSGGAEWESVSAPLQAAESPIYGTDIFGLSDLLFWLCGVQPIKIRRSKFDPDSPLVRLSFRDLMWYCYLQQDHLDSSFFRMEDPFKRLKSRDAMRFVTGLHSERMNEIEGELVKTTNEQRTKREAVVQMRMFMNRFHMGTEIDLLSEQRRVEDELRAAAVQRDKVDQAQLSETHAVEPLRDRLRQLSAQVEDAQQSLGDVADRIREHESLRAELITSKVKASRAAQAGRLLDGVEFERCPQCGAELAARSGRMDACSLCGTPQSLAQAMVSAPNVEALRRDLNERIDELAESLERYGRERDRKKRVLGDLIQRKKALDEELAQELRRYDSAYVATARAADRDVARLQERLASLERLRELPQAISTLEEQAGSLQGRIDSLRSAMADEQRHLEAANQRVREIAARFLGTLLQVKFPGVYPDDRVELDPRSWLPYVHHGDQTWGFYEAGAGGKKTLFNVCYALAVHAVAAAHGLPLPTFLIIDSPTKNISEVENPDVVGALYREVYALASRQGRHPQLLLIDSDLARPDSDLPEYSHRRMAGTPEEPSLISYYVGP